MKLNDSQINQVIECVNHFLKVADTKYQPGLLKYDPLIKFTLKGRTAGTALYKANEHSILNFNSILLNENMENFMEDTIPHEVAHLIARALYGPRIRPHGREWKSVMINFGVNPKRCHYMDTTNSIAKNTNKFVYHCKCDGRKHVIGSNRHKKIQNRLKFFKCAMCNSKIEYTSFKTTSRAIAAQRAAMRTKK